MLRVRRDAIVGIMVVEVRVGVEVDEVFGVVFVWSGVWMMLSVSSFDMADAAFDCFDCDFQRGEHSFF